MASVSLTRSFRDQTFLTPVPPLTPALSQRPAPPLDEIRRRRQEYVDTLKELMRAPDGNYVEGFTLPGHSRPPTPVPKKGEFERNNPLSLDEEVHNSHPALLNLSLTLIIRILGNNGLNTWICARPSYKTYNARKYNLSYEIGILKIGQVSGTIILS